MADHLADNPPPSDRLDEIFELSVLQEDFNYSYNGLILSCIKPTKKVASSQFENDKMEDYLNNFWSECPIAGCGDASCGPDRYVYTSTIQIDLDAIFRIIQIFSDKSGHSKRSRLFKHHISGYHSQAKYKLHTLSFENENELAPVRCYACNWFFFKYRDRKEHLERGECSEIIAAIVKLKESGLWDKIKFKPNIRPKAIQVEKNHDFLEFYLKRLGNRRYCIIEQLEKD